MTRLPGHCAVVSVASAALAILFLVADVPAGALLATTPALVCVGLHLALGPGGGHSDRRRRGRRRVDWPSASCERPQPPATPRRGERAGLTEP